MPPKKKGGKAKKAKKVEVVKDEYDAMDLEQLTEEVKKTTAKLNEIRRNRNFYLIERDQVQQFNDIVHEEVVKTESHIRNIESQMEKMQDTHRNDIRIYLQKVSLLSGTRVCFSMRLTRAGRDDACVVDVLVIANCPHLAYTHLPPRAGHSLGV